MLRKGPPTAEILKTLTSSESFPSKVDREGNEIRTSDADRLDAHLHVVDIAQTPANVRTFCTGCDADIAIIDGAICACGGIVCAACQAREVEGECHHEERDHRQTVEWLTDLANAKREANNELVIAKRWRDFRTQAIKRVTDADALVMLRSVFYAGAFSTLGAVADALALPQPQRGEQLQAIHQEMAAWIADQTTTDDDDEDDDESEVH